MTTKTPRETITDALWGGAVPSVTRADAEAAKILSALTAAGYTVEKGWRPIDDAAKTGDGVLLGRTTDDFIALAYWDDEDWPDHPWCVGDSEHRYHRDAFTNYKPKSTPPAPGEKVSG